MLEANAGSSDQRRISGFAREVRIGALVEHETGPLFVAAAKGDDQSGVAVAILGVDNSWSVAGKYLDRLVAVLFPDCFHQVIACVG